MSSEEQKFSRVLKYTEHLLILVSAITECVPISAFASLLGVSTRIMSSVTGLEIFSIT